jgi:hypothetical protein
LQSSCNKIQKVLRKKKEEEEYIVCNYKENPKKNIFMKIKGLAKWRKIPKSFNNVLRYRIEKKNMIHILQES